MGEKEGEAEKTGGIGTGEEGVREGRAEHSRTRGVLGAVPSAAVKIAIFTKKATIYTIYNISITLVHHLRFSNLSKTTDFATTKLTYKLSCINAHYHHIDMPTILPIS